jgi:hypothetical protein
MGRQNLELRSPLGRQATDDRLKLWSSFLRLSPSYNVARQLSKGEISKSAAEKTVADIDIVNKTYGNFGDVWQMTEEEHWQRNSYELFGVHLAELNLKVVHVMQEGQAIDRYELDQAMQTYVEHTRAEMGNPLTALVSIPIDMNRADLVRLFNGMITYFKDNREDYVDENVPEPKYKMSGEKKHLKVLREYIDLVEYRAMQPHMQLWLVGQNLNVNRHYADALRTEGKLNQSGIVDAKNALTATVGRIQRQAMLVAENAARGFYPSYTQGNSFAKKFDFERLQKMLIEYRK